MSTTHAPTRRLALIGVLTLALTALHAADVCPLRVNDESGLTTPWPLVGGLPLPTGAVRDATNIRIVDAQGREVPAQIDVAATYRDGSIRWALVSLVGPVTDEYRAEFGPDVKRADATGITLTEKDGALEINTGAAVFTVSKANLLADSARLLDGRDGIALWGTGEAAAYLIDNQGRTATCAGDKAEIQRTMLKPGPLRCVVRTEGWYVTEQGERVARGIARMSFFANSTMVQISHTLVLTEDTNKLWVRDYGLDVPMRTLAPAQATFDTAKTFDETVKVVDLKPGDTASMMQDDFPHFLETGSHFSLAQVSGGTTEELLSGAACGEWCDASSPQAGLTAVIRDLAEQFPKELEVSTSGVRIHFWPARCGREWDFRAPTLIKEYWGKWIETGIWSQDNRVNKLDKVAKTPSNAQGSAKTHEVWLIPHTGPLDVATMAKQAHAACRPALLQADPAFLCATGAMTWPMHPKDAKRFPAEEATIADFFDRITLPYRVFPLTGLIEWGSCPYLDYEKQNGRWTADLYRTAWSVEYGVRRHVWALYARSGDRKYYEYAARFNTHCADWDMAHWDAPPDVFRGGFGFNYGSIHEPFHWRGPKTLMQMDNSGHDVVHWLSEYYLTGNEYAIETTRLYGEALAQAWKPEEAAKSYAQFLLLRVLVALHTREWDPAFRKMADELAGAIIDLDAPNGLSKDLNVPYGPLYKVDRSALVLYDYWWATGNDRAKQAFLKALDYQYRFNHIPAPTSYQNASAYLFTIAYDWTGRQEYLRVVNHQVQAALLQERVRLGDELKGATDLNTLDRLPYRGAHTNMHYLLGMPTAMAALAKTDRPVPPWPVLATPGFATEAVFAALEKPAGQAVSFGVFIQKSHPGQVSLQILGPDGKPVVADIRPEERIPFRDWELPGQGKDKTAAPLPLPVHVRVTIPTEAPPGTYRIDTGGQGSFTIQDATVDRVFLACPDGVWLSPDGLPVYFGVPQGVDLVKLFVTHPVTVLRADGSIGMDEKELKMGEVTVPVDGKFGAWSVKARPRTGPPIPFSPHIRFLNVPPAVAMAPENLPQAQLAPPPEMPAWTPPPGDFVEGIAGQAMHFTQGRTVKFPRGAALPDGGYEHFPSRQGTIEFWFRPDWTSAWLTLKDGQEVRSNFVNGGAIAFYYRYGFGAWKDNFYANLDLLTRGVLGKPEEKKRDEVGGMAKHFFHAGEWVHLAAVWKMVDGKTGAEGDFAVYINGRRQPRTWDYPFALTGKNTYVLKDATPSIAVGCHDGCIDELRISKVPRYDKDFDPLRQPFTSDADTAVLFHFDGTPDAVTGADANPVKAEVQPGK